MHRSPPGSRRRNRDRASASGRRHLRDAYAVKSTDLNNAYFISAEIDGPKSWAGVATWAKSGPLAVGDGLIFAIDDSAKFISDWPDGLRAPEYEERSNDATLSIGDDGAEESRDCVEALRAGPESTLSTEPTDSAELTQGYGVGMSIAGAYPNMDCERAANLFAAGANGTSSETDEEYLSNFKKGCEAGHDLNE